MISFQPVTPDYKNKILPYLNQKTEKGCELSFANLCLWGTQSFAIMHHHLVFYTCYNGFQMYPFPIADSRASMEDTQKVIAALQEDAKEKNIPLCFGSVYTKERTLLETVYPSQFDFSCKRESFDYVYDINDLADLEGRKYHKKRTHFNRFSQAHPDYIIKPLSKETLSLAENMANKWYRAKALESPDNNFSGEQAALQKAFRYYSELCMEGLLLMEGDNVLAFTMGSPLNDTTFDVHFEKADASIDGAYTTINRAFARHIREKYPSVSFLNREEDMGLEGLRKAKLSYYPHHLTEKCLAMEKRQCCD